MMKRIKCDGITFYLNRPSTVIRHNAISRGANRGRGGDGNNNPRGHYNNTNNDRSNRPDNSDNNGAGFRSRGGFNRGGRGGPSRFYPRGNNNRVSSHEHSSSRRSSRSLDRSFSYRRDHDSDRYLSTSSGFSAPSTDEFSHRPLPTEALRKKDKSNFDTSSNDSTNDINRSSVITEETIASRSGHTS